MRWNALGISKIIVIRGIPVEVCCVSYDFQRVEGSELRIRRWLDAGYNTSQPSPIWSPGCSVLEWHCLCIPATNVRAIDYHTPNDPPENPQMTSRNGILGEELASVSPRTRRARILDEISLSALRPSRKNRPACTQHQRRKVYQ